MLSGRRSVTDGYMSRAQSGSLHSNDLDLSMHVHKLQKPSNAECTDEIAHLRANVSEMASHLNYANNVPTCRALMTVLTQKNTTNSLFSNFIHYFCTTANTVKWKAIRQQFPLALINQPNFLLTTRIYCVPFL